MMTSTRSVNVWEKKIYNYVLENGGVTTVNNQSGQFSGCTFDMCLKTALV